MQGRFVPLAPRLAPIAVLLGLCATCSSPREDVTPQPREGPPPAARERSAAQARQETRPPRVRGRFSDRELRRSLELHPLIHNRNVLLVIADDVGVEQIALYADELAGPDKYDTVGTVAIDRLAAAGVRFRNAWANPSCSPTRAGVFTGQYAFVHGVTSPMAVEGGAGLDPERDSATDPAPYASLPAAAAGTGMRFGLFGKWHLGEGDFLPTNNGWDRFYGAVGGELPSYHDWHKTEDESSRDVTGTFATSENVDDALEWIREQDAAGRRWMAMVAFNAAHSTRDAAGEQWLRDDLSPDCYDETNPFPPIEGTVPYERHVYKSMLRCLDFELGRLLAELEADGGGLLSSTTIFFIGDNGTPTQVAEGALTETFEGQTKAKGSLFQGGVRVPFIAADGYWLVNDPGEEERLRLFGVGVLRDPGRVEDALVHTRDLYATVLAIAGPDPAPHSPPSRSLIPYLYGVEHPDPAEFLFTQGGSSYAIRNERFKLIRRASGSEWLFRLENDPWERKDVLGSKSAYISAHETLLRDALDAIVP